MQMPCTVPGLKKSNAWKPIQWIGSKWSGFSSKRVDVSRFSGSVSEDAPYCIDHERWSNLERRMDFLGLLEMAGRVILTEAGYAAHEIQSTGNLLLWNLSEPVSQRDIGKDIIFDKT